MVTSWFAFPTKLISNTLLALGAVSVNWPFWSVTAFAEPFFTETVAPAIGFPDWSVTVPVTLVGTLGWAHTLPHKQSIKSKTDIFISPFAGILSTFMLVVFKKTVL